MSRDAAAVAHDLGAVLFVPSAIAALAAVVAWLTADAHLVGPLLVIAVPGAAAGTYLLRRFRHVRAQHRWPAIEVVALGWLLSGLAVAGMLFAIGWAATDGATDLAFRDPMNALFEGMSGITSTGLTMVGGQEAGLTATAQWLRSLSQWVGGVGMVIFALAFTSTSTGMRELYEAEGRHPDLPGGVSGTVRQTATIYVTLTVAAIAALAATEQDLWTSINHGLTGISTGGFTITGRSLAGFGPATQVVAMLVIVVGAVSFVAHHVLLVQRDPVHWWRLTPVRSQVLVLGGGALAIVVLNGPDIAVLDSVFQWTSASGTAGFHTGPQLDDWALPAFALLIVGMIVGAPSGSTGGGLKLDRVVWLAKAASRALARDWTITWDRAGVPPGRAATLVRHAVVLGVLWLVTLAIATSAVALLHPASPRAVVFDVASALSNVGLSAGFVGRELDGASKLVFVVVMYIGRLELLLALFLATQAEQA